MCLRLCNTLVANEHTVLTLLERAESAAHMYLLSRKKNPIKNPLLHHSQLMGPVQLHLTLSDLCYQLTPQQKIAHRLFFITL